MNSLLRTFGPRMSKVLFFFILSVYLSVFLINNMRLYYNIWTKKEVSVNSINHRKRLRFWEAPSKDILLKSSIKSSLILVLCLCQVSKVMWFVLLVSFLKWSYAGSILEYDLQYYMSNSLLFRPFLEERVPRL